MLLAAFTPDWLTFITCSAALAMAIDISNIKPSNKFRRVCIYIIE